VAGAWDVGIRQALSIRKKLAVTSLTSGDCLVGIVRLQIFFFSIICV
jgi:hypothetical protein